MLSPAQNTAEAPPAKLRWLVPALSIDERTRRFPYNRDGMESSEYEDRFFAIRPCLAPSTPPIRNTIIIWLRSEGLIMEHNEAGKVVPIRELKFEEGADELTGSAMMEPYVRLAEAVITHEGIREAITEIAGLPLEQRYLWRVLSALKWAFADFDNVNVAIDRKTLRPEDREKVVDLIQYRPVQFCMFLKALLGEEAMEEMITKAINVAKKVPSAR